MNLITAIICMLMASLVLSKDDGEFHREIKGDDGRVGVGIGGRVPVGPGNVTVEGDLMKSLDSSHLEPSASLKYSMPIMKHGEFHGKVKGDGGRVGVGIGGRVPVGPGNVTVEGDLMKSLDSSHLEPSANVKYSMPIMKDGEFHGEIKGDGGRVGVGIGGRVPVGPGKLSVEGDLMKPLHSSHLEPSANVKYSMPIMGSGDIHGELNAGRGGLGVGIGASLPIGLGLLSLGGNLMGSSYSSYFGFKIPFKK